MLELRRAKFPSSSERDSRIYCLPILKRTNDLAISRYSCTGTAKKFAKIMIHVQSC